MERTVILTIIIVCSWYVHTINTQSTDGYDEERHVEYPPFDGWFNNFFNPAWGAAETQLLRKVAPVYSDGSYEPAGEDRPPPMNVTRVVFVGETGHESYKGRTAFMVFFGQQVVEEVLDAQRPGCPPEYFNLNIPKEHEHFSNDSDAVNVMPFLRSRYAQDTGYSPNNPRQQLNEISSYIDGTLVYGPNKAWTDAIREFKDGLLLVDEVKGPYGGEFPGNNSIRLPFANPPPPRDHPELKPVARFNRIGNPRGNENPFLLTMGIMWFRYHNYWARELKKDHPDWSDEQLFNTARKMLIAVYQKIVTEDWLPNWLGNETHTGLPPYTGYNPSIHPGIAHVFQTSAMRFGHTMVPPGVYRRDKNCEFRNTTRRTEFADKVAVRTCNSYWNPQESVYESDIDEYIMGMASQVAEREDNIITPDLRGNVFGNLEFNRRDLMAVNIQRARDHGVPDFNTVRRAYGLPDKEWEDIIVHPDIPTSIIDEIRVMYDDDVNKLDLWVGGMLETNEGPGETFRAIITDQFTRIRDGDRFWYENRENGLYSEDEVNLIKSIDVLQVIKATTTIQDGDIQPNPFFIDGNNCTPPYGQLNHSNGLIEDCTPRQTFDYFTGSEISYIVSVIALFLTFFVFLGILWFVVKKHNKDVIQAQAKSRQNSKKRTAAATANMHIFTLAEWQGPKEKWHNVKVKLDKTKKHVVVNDDAGKLLRTIDLKMLVGQGFTTIDTYLSVDSHMDMMIIKIPREYDLVLRFDSTAERQHFLDTFKAFLDGEPGMTSPRAISTKQMFIEAVSKENRKKQLEHFFKAVFAHITHDEDRSTWTDMSRRQSVEVLHSELTKHEFAESLGLRPHSTFVESMFNMIDVDRSGSVSFREFVDLIVVFYKGDADEKMRLLFDMYDFDKTGTLSRDEFKNMLKSLVELSNSQIEEENITDLIQSLCERAGINQKGELSFSDFKHILKDYKTELNYAVLDFQLDGVNMPKNMQRENAPIRARKTLYKTYSVDESAIKNKRMTMQPASTIKTIQRDFPDTPAKKRWNVIKRYIENYKLQMFWLVLYTLVSIGIFAERSYYYSVEREHAGLRRIAGDGVTVTRGAASGMMFTYSCLLVTMCRNIITALRETFLHRYVPFDAAVDFHKYISLWALIFTALHIIGHCINFYHISTQTANDLSCLFRNFFHATDELPKFHDWLWRTLTGFTGVLLTVQMFMIYIFAIQYSRRHSFKSFWITHNSYFIFFTLMILHGMGRLVQAPFTHYFLLGPAILFTIDRLISVSRKKIEIAVVRAELLPSNVTCLEFKKPHNFDYKSGQWLRIACTVMGKDEYHPFTISSAPHEENVSLHIRAVGPWTHKLRRVYNPEIVKEHPWPKVLIDGPFGEGHQDWYKFEVAVLVGGGIGVTPFTSILKDIAHKSKTGTPISCKKIYFIWVTRTQKQFEWVTDIIREVEEADRLNLVAVHIFITEFKQKFDIRTTMLYICERYFQKISQRSLFTGLQSITHFGRPDFLDFFNMLSTEHTETKLFGVFSCGPPPMTNNVEKACQKMNNSTADILFVHHFENF